MAVCKHVYYWGKVQGVGFRYTVQTVASRFTVTGYVKNLPDGQVELVAEGEAAELDRFLSNVAQKMGGYIQGQRTAEEIPQGFEGFAIRY